MAKRMILMLLAVAAFVGAIGFVKYRQITTAIAAGMSFVPPPEAVTTVVATAEPWPESVNAIGSVAAAQGVVVGADLPGVVSRIAFESGAQVKRGDILVELDARQEEAQLAAAEAQRDLARLNLERMRDLFGKGIVPTADRDRVAAEATQSDARVGELRATIARKRIRAPFAGVLGIRRVNLGQYLESGTAIVPLQALDPLHVDFSVPQQELARVRVGAEVRIAAEGKPPIERVGKLTAIDSVVEASTRNVRVQVTLANPDGALRPGMFVQAKVVFGESAPQVALPATAVSYAPYGDSVFIVEDVKGPKGETYRGVRQQFVKLGGGRGDQVAVLSGVKPGEEVVTSGLFRLRNGAAVEVNNRVQPANSIAPTPEEG